MVMGMENIFLNFFNDLVIDGKISKLLFSSEYYITTNDVLYYTTTSSKIEK